MADACFKIGAGSWLARLVDWGGLREKQSFRLSAWLQKKNAAE